MTFTRAQQANRKPKAPQPLKRLKRLENGKTVNKISGKGVRKFSQFVAMCRARQNENCYCCAKIGVVKKMETLHHVLPRSQGGENSHSNLMPICNEHHRWIHDNPKESLILGLLKSRYNRTTKGE